MTLSKPVLVLHKKSAYEEYFGEYKSPSIRHRFRRGDPTLVGLKASHAVHYRTLGVVGQALKERGLRYRIQPRERSFDRRRFGLVVTVGGDGTVLEAAAALRDEPLLAVNSDPNHSVGMFCAADRRTFARLLDAFLKGRARVVAAHRLALRLDGKALPAPVLNDILVAHANPAAMSHYMLEIGPKREQQRGSGMWVATAAGSTGGIKSAGGRPLPLGSPRVQYMPRELYRSRRHGYRLTGGLLPAGKLKLKSLMPEGMVYADGAHHPAPFGFGSVLEVSPAAWPLNLVMA